MEEYKLELKQIVDYPRCRMYRQFVQSLILNNNLRVNGNSHLYYYTVLCCYANFRTSYHRVKCVTYTLYAGFGFIKSKAGRYVNEACWKYGFIIRYPSFGESETGIPFEPWHLRYVGEPHAKIIYNNHLTLEEYIQSLHMGVWYETDGYILSRQQANADGSLLMPNDFGKATISPDITGCYVITIPTVDKK